MRARPRAHAPAFADLRKGVGRDQRVRAVWREMRCRKRPLSPGMTWSRSARDFLLKRHGGRGNRIAQLGQIAVNPGAAHGRVADLLDVKDIRTVLGALEFVQIFKFLFHESDPVGLARLPLEGAFPCLAMDQEIAYRPEIIQLLVKTL